jgi:hydroxyethylthiazole kinase
MEIRTFAELLNRVREMRPLVHHITNTVTINDCANITLHTGGAPVMAHAPEEVEEMVGLASSLVLNIGTLTSSQVAAMLLAGKQANRRGIPVVLDPVGAGATRFRTESVRRILEEVQVTIVKGNAAEIATLAGERAEVRGVDAGEVAADPIQAAQTLARQLSTVVVVTGKTDIITDGTRTACVDNGHHMMGCITGTGCMGASVLGCFAPVVDDPWIAAVAAVTAYTIAGEIGGESADGPGSFKWRFFDAMAGLNAEKIAEKAKIRQVAPSPNL